MVVDVGKMKAGVGPDDSLISKVDGCVGILVHGDDSAWGCIEAIWGGADMQYIPSTSISRDGW